MKTMTLDEFKQAFKAQGVPIVHLAMRCPVCKTLQSGADLIAAGAGTNIDEVEACVGFSCVGRWTDAGPHKRGDPPGKGCDLTLGGLLHLHELEVVASDGETYLRFLPATPEEAQNHMKAKGLEVPAMRTCRFCGCTDACACDGGCHWVEVDVCSRCEEKVAELAPAP
jgi:hypothetical protein